jgi:outer membrane receptor protein involved in Fe transport
MTAISYARPTGWFARLEAQYQSEFFFSDSHDQQASSRLLVNLAAGYERDRWRIELWMRNALNEDYAQRGFFFGNEPPDFPDRLYIQLAEPRRAGLSVRWAFN